MDKKKVLLICKESYANPMNFIADRFLNDGYQVDALFIHSSESIYEDKSLSLFKKRNNRVNTLSIKSVVQEYQRNVSQCDKFIDYEYLELIESKYCKDLPLSLLQISSQLFTTAYHYRFFFNEMSNDQKLYYIQLLFNFIEKLISEGGYIKICDLDIAEIGRSVLLQVAKVHHLPYVSLEFSRYDDYVLPTYNLGRTTDQYFIKEFNSCYTNQIEDEYLSDVSTYINNNKIQPLDYKNNTTSKKNAKPFYSDVKVLLIRLKEVASRLPGWLRNGRSDLLANPLKSACFFVLWFIRERYLFSGFNKYFTLPKEDEKYVYFPLHLIPESTTLNKSPFYPNELSVVETISKALPVGWKLYVKEHGAMIGERPLAFYKQLSKLTNIRLVKLNFYDDPKPWITNSRGVITLSGTTAFEAAMLGKMSAIYGNTFFEVIPGITKLETTVGLLEFMKQIKEPEEVSLQAKAAYIKAVKNSGVQFPILSVLKDCQNSMLNNQELSSVTHRSLDDLYSLYLKDMS
jgi:hypothetical protein